MSQEIETLHQPFAKYLRSIPLPFTYHDPTRPTTSTLGDADFIIYRGVLCLHIEFKTKEGKPSKSQIERHKELAAVGTRVHICRKLEPAIELVQAMIGGEPCAHSQQAQAAIADVIPAQQKSGTTATALPAGASNGAQPVQPASAPKEYLAEARHVGTVVVARNREGHMGFVRMAKAADRGLLPWTEALEW